MIIEYMLVREMDLKRAPSWIEDGGYFQNPDDFTLIGWSPDEGQRDYYIPDSVVVLTREELVARQLAIHAKYPARKMDPANPGEESVMTEQEVTDMINAWCETRI